MTNESVRPSYKEVPFTMMRMGLAVSYCHIDRFLVAFSCMCTERKWPCFKTNFR